MDAIRPTAFPAAVALLMGGALAASLAHHLGAPLKRRVLAAEPLPLDLIKLSALGLAVASALLGGVWSTGSGGADDLMAYSLIVGIVLVAAVVAGYQLTRRAMEIAAPPTPQAAAQAVSTAPATCYDITHLPLFWALCDYGESDGIWMHCYLALCRAYEVPPHWEADQLRRLEAHERWAADGMPPVPIAFSIEYAVRRRPFLELARSWMSTRFAGQEGAFGQDIHALMESCYFAPRALLVELDATFFSAVYGADARQTFSYAVAERDYGMPTYAEQVHAWRGE